MFSVKHYHINVDQVKRYTLLLLCIYSRNKVSCSISKQYLPLGFFCQGNRIGPVGTRFVPEICNRRLCGHQ